MIVGRDGNIHMGASNPPDAIAILIGCNRRLRCARIHNRHTVDAWRRRPITCPLINMVESSIHCGLKHRQFQQSDDGRTARVCERPIAWERGLAGLRLVFHHGHVLVVTDVHAGRRSDFIPSEAIVRCIAVFTTERIRGWNIALRNNADDWHSDIPSDPARIVRGRRRAAAADRDRCARNSDPAGWRQEDVGDWDGDHRRGLACSRWFENGKRQSPQVC